MSNRTLWKIKIDVHQIYNLRLADSTELPDPYIAASLELPRAARTAFPVQRSASKSKTSSGTFNAVMLFIANIYDFDFERVKLSVRVHNGKRLTELLSADGALIGSSTFSLSKVYEQTKHWIPREWVAITSDTAPGDIRGYINVSIGVFGPGDDVPSQLNEFQVGHHQQEAKNAISRSIFEKIVQTPETNFNKCLLVFNLLRAENLPVLNARGQTVPCSTYVRVSFVGQSATTRVIPSNSNPAWNESVRIPVLNPTWDQWVVVEVFSRTSESDLLLGSAIFDFTILYKVGIQPTWFNLYSADDSGGGRNPAFAALFGGEFSGRVQVSSSVSRLSDLHVSVIPCDAATQAEPQTEELVVYIDIYELSFLDEAMSREAIPPEIWIQVQFGPNIFESEHIANSSMTCIFGESMGRLAPIRIHLPVIRAMAYDMVLSVIGQKSDGSRVRLCHSRFGIDRFTTTVSQQQHVSCCSADPEWLRLSTITAPESKNIFQDFFFSSPAGSDHNYDDDRLLTVASLLANISAFRIVKGQFPDRPARIAYKMSTYELRFSVHQACNLPASTNELSSTCCRVTLAGASARTSVIPNTLFPVWNEGLRIEVDLPSIQTLRPDVLIEVVEQTSGLVLGVATLKSSALRSTWVGPPSWLRLRRSGMKSSEKLQQESLILCSAVLVSELEANTLPVLSPLPQRGAFSVDLLIVGVRLVRNFSVERLNQIEISWGRHRDKPKKRVVSIRTADPIAGEGGQFNFLQPALLDLDLAVDATFQEFLEIRLFQDGQESTSDQQSRLGAIGYGFLHLNPHYAWLPEAERSQYRELFRVKTIEELRMAQEASRMRSSEGKKKRNNVTASSGNRDWAETEFIESEIEAAYGVSVASENCLDLIPDFFDAVETENLLPRNFRSAPARAKQQPAAALDALFSSEQSQQKFMKNFVWEPLVSREKSDKARPVLESHLEDRLDRDLLPFISMPLVAGNSVAVVGYLKVRCRVREKSSDASELLALQKTFMQQYQQSTHLVCRLYMLRAEGVVPSQGAAAAASGSQASGQLLVQEAARYFLWIRNVAGELVGEYPNCSIKDDGEGQQQSSKIEVSTLTNPEFSKCFQLPCSLPENALLHIELYERRSLSAGDDSLVGTATIDLENRWFHPAFQDMVSLGVPVEAWNLRSPEGIPKGKIRFWLELMDQVTAMGRAIETLPSAQSEEVQVRIVLWRTRGVIPPAGEENCHIGVSAFMQDLPRQDSDTHFGSTDGAGTFNWRFVFNPRVPSDDTTLRFTVQHRPLTSIAGIGHVSIGEVTLDLSQELAHVRKTRRGIDLPRCWVPLTLASFAGKIRGSMEIQIRVVSSEEARSFRVGSGRDEPNLDPFLNPADPHLVLHRNALANTAIGRSLAKFVDAMRSGLRWATILFIVGGVISAIVALVLFLVYIGAIKIN